jgi:sigma-E factor negative regulatory protein RseA
MMNAATFPSQLPDNAPASAVSALVDGELSPDELDAVLAHLAEAESGLTLWDQYQLIGDALRGGAPLVTGRSPEVFLAGIRAQLQTSPSEAGALEPSPTLLPSATHQPLRTLPAANDALFRWKMVAGLSSLMAVMAVMAVSWTVLESSPAARDVPGAQIATLSPAGISRPAGGPAAGRLQPVVVETPQGPVLRDPQLESLLAQHRQYGDMSALHKTTGFLRSATYDVPSR